MFCVTFSFFFYISINFINLIFLAFLIIYKRTTIKKKYLHFINITAIKYKKIKISNYISHTKFHAREINYYF